ncbi:patatin-like phospholipase family protein [Actinokineospora bangkokensis]|uniref:Patatin n=1 Tax=Actinokineospora bangkokensis TaxID=1193682 RepID=A0A1Q9LLI0_9PSEU|nr:patatin-like phospholipase family protein [Actinokineospora bangkokensis]OLR92880.1 patatin [Actinokineospora bangkokensis]
MAEALVLGGGGVGGIAWMTGVLAGLAEVGRDVSGAGVLVGTSAGSTVAAQVGSGLGLHELYARQTEPGLQAAELVVEWDLEGFVQRLTAAAQGRSPVELRRVIGAMALAAETVPAAQRLAVIQSRLPVQGWPERDVRVVAVDAESGDMRVFDRDSGVRLVDAVAASCAVPGVWPPVEIEGRHYIDGGVRSNENADLALGCEQVVVLAPMGVESPLPGEKPLAVAVEELRAAGARVAVVVPDSASVEAVGVNPLDPACRRPAAEAGLAQGRALEPAFA